MAKITGNINYNDLYNTLLINPYKNKNIEVNKLLIVSGYASSAMSYRTIKDFMEINKNKNFQINLILGMSSRDGISKTEHKGFNNLVNNFPDYFKCSYRKKKSIPVHSKLYVWCKKSTPICAFTGSANYSQNALILKQQEELMVECNPKQAAAYYNAISKESVLCSTPIANKLINIYSPPIIEPHKKSAKQSIGHIDTERLECKSISLLIRGEKIAPRSGLNWGQRPGRDHNQAYLSIPITIVRSQFFPEGKTCFTVYTDDDRILHCVIAQDGDKALHTYDSNSELGLYFRNRLGLESGAFVKKEDLENYGRTDVDFYKIDNETYYMDFSSAK